MRKKIITTDQNKITNPDQNWLDLEDILEVEMTSEDASFPIESALLAGHEKGWRAATIGKQTIRLLFTKPQRLQKIRLEFEETSIDRTQEYLLRWSLNGESFQEIVRQQWNFSPSGSTIQIEEYQVELQAITVLELIIIPDINGGDAIATLSQIQLA